MACKKTKKLKKLVDACLAERLFEEDLTTSVFLTFLEVLRNFKRKKFKQCFTPETRKKAKKHKKLINKLLNPDIREKKRKKMFLSASSKFRDFCYGYLIKNFFDCCVE